MLFRAFCFITKLCDCAIVYCSVCMCACACQCSFDVSRGDYEDDRSKCFAFVWPYYTTWLRLLLSRILLSTHRNVTCGDFRDVITLHVTKRVYCYVSFCVCRVIIWQPLNLCFCGNTSTPHQ